MESGIDKLKIVWICNFINQTIQKKLGMNGNEKEFGPWIPLGIEEIKKRNDIELHVISPCYRIFKNRKLTDRNIHYHFIRIGIPFLRTAWRTWFKFDAWSNYYFFNFQVKKLVKEINPDLVNLQGAENALYSSSILGIKGYPILVTIQGFITLHNLNNSKIPGIRKRIQIEEQILRKLKYFGIEAIFMEKYIRTFNPSAKMFWFHCPFARTNIIGEVPKEYDLVFFAGLSKMKGIEDLIKAVLMARNRKPEISLCIIGKGNETYINYLKQLVEDLNLKNNIVFKGFIPTQEEMHLEVAKARISVLPTYNDTIPGTITESMLLGVPVISYNTGGIPDLNKDEEHVILVEQGNIDKLAHEIIKLLTNTNKQKELAERAMKYASVEFDNANSVNLMVHAYRDVIKDFKNEH
jgi:colanic acid/amylovoran biosynthesis glycosyltransferase